MEKAVCKKHKTKQSTKTQKTTQNLGLAKLISEKEDLRKEILSMILRDN